MLKYAEGSGSVQSLSMCMKFIAKRKKSNQAEALPEKKQKKTIKQNRLICQGRVQIPNKQTNQ